MQWELPGDKSEGERQKKARDDLPSLKIALRRRSAKENPHPLSLHKNPQKKADVRFIKITNGFSKPILSYKIRKYVYVNQRISSSILQRQSSISPNKK